MVDINGRWYPDYPGQLPQQDPAYLRSMRGQMQFQQAQQQAQSQQMQPPAIQQSWFVRVQSEQEARAYPVAPGNSITFKDERQPYCYVKTMSYNQLDPPTFERYRLLKEDSPSEARESPTAHEQPAPSKKYHLRHKKRSGGNLGRAGRTEREIKSADGEKDRQGAESDRRNGGGRR